MDAAERTLVADALTASDSVGASLERSFRRLSALTPFSAESVRDFDDDALDRVDAFLKRFENLIGVAQKQLFRSLILFEGEDHSVMSAREIVLTLERWRILPSAEMWLAAVAARNRIAHEYPRPPEEVANALNEAFAAAQQIAPVVAAAAAHLRAKLEGLEP